MFFIYFFLNKNMISHPKDSIFNSKELNKILPSYLLDEIDKEDNKNSNDNNEDNFIDYAFLKEPSKVR